MSHEEEDNWEPHTDAEGSHVCTEDASDEIDHDLGDKNEHFHTAYIGVQEARNIIRQARVAHGF